MNAPRPVLRRYADVRDLIETADLLLFRRPRGILSACSKAISIAGRSDYTHAAMAVHWAAPAAADARFDERGRLRQSFPTRPILLCAEVREWVGGRVVTLSSQVDRYPGRIDVYKLPPSQAVKLSSSGDSFSRYRTAAAMLRKAGHPYGWSSILNSSLAFLPGVRWLRSDDFEDESRKGQPEYCSAAVSNAHRAGGLDVVPNLADQFTLPGDLARSACFRYAFTLEPDGRGGA